MAGGRPIGLTPEVQRVIIEALKSGNYINTAARIAGIDRKTFYNWLERGRLGEEPFAEFFHTCESTIAEAESSAVKNIREAGKKNWQAFAWWLERRHRDRWAKNTDLGAATQNSPDTKKAVTVKTTKRAQK